MSDSATRHRSVGVPALRATMYPSDLRWMENPAARSSPFVLPDSARRTFAAVDAAHALHRSMPGYRPTPLVSLDALARLLDVRSVWVKDESRRLGLGAFKVLGSSFAVARHLAESFGFQGVPAFDQLAEAVRSQTRPVTFASATAGNHGHGLAWVARRLGAQAVIYLPAGREHSLYERIASEGAEVIRTDLDYDRTVEFAAADARDKKWTLIQDTAWDGYDRIPEWTMQGYLTLIHEAAAQCLAVSDEMPTHVIVQAGVGSLAAAVQSYLSARWGNERPRTVVVEPLSAACLLRTARARDGKVHASEARPSTVMSGLACRQPNPQAWEILRSQADLFLACSDEFAARGMRILACPVGLDERVESGESGAVGLGVLSAVRLGSQWSAASRAIGLDWDSRVLVINTEGATAPAHYRRVVWDGALSFGSATPERAPCSCLAPSARRSRGKALAEA